MDLNEILRIIRVEILMQGPKAKKIIYCLAIALKQYAKPDNDYGFWGAKLEDLLDEYEKNNREQTL